MLNQQVAVSANGIDLSKLRKRQKLSSKCERCGAVFEQTFYGVKSIKTTCRSCSAKAAHEKAKQTFLKKYGVDNPAKAKEVQAKIKATNLERYGATSPGKNEAVKEKQRQTLRDKYGSTNPGALANHIKFMQYRDSETSSVGLVWLDKDCFHGKYDDNGPIYYSFKCLKCGKTFKDDFHSGEPFCPYCHPKRMGASKPEDDLYEMIASFYKGEIVRHDYTVLDGKELDMYFPDKSIAIEFNGDYWHSYRQDIDMTLSEFKRKVQLKRIECAKRGVRLINIDECDWKDRPDVFKRFFEDLLLPRKRVFARDCSFKPIDLETAKSFCNMYHVNGFRGGSEKYGLFYKDELLCVAIFGKNKRYGWECIRLCYKTGYDIIGGWAKIQKHFGRQFLHYVNLKYFEGENRTGCGYRIKIRGKVLYRNQLQKESDLRKYCKTVDPKLSSFQNCLRNNGYVIFDVGNDIRVYNTKEQA